MKRNTPNEPAASSPPPAKPAKKRSPMLVAASAAQRHAKGTETQTINAVGLIEAAAAARSLLSKLSARLEIDEELHAEISRVEETLWGVLFPGAQPPKRKWSFNDEGFACHVDLGDVHNELKRRL